MVNEKTKILGRGKRWLSNRFNEGGAIRWEIEQYVFTNAKGKPEGKGNWGYLEFRDCSRLVSLDFHCNSKRDKKARLKKIDTIITELNKMREALEKVDV